MKPGKADRMKIRGEIVIGVSLKRNKIGDLRIEAETLKGETRKRRGQIGRQSWLLIQKIQIKKAEDPKMKLTLKRHLVQLRKRLTQTTDKINNRSMMTKERGETSQSLMWRDQANQHLNLLR